jgi:hypothetical protein
MRMTRLTTMLSLAALAAAIAGSGRASAAPVYLQDYEPPGNLDAPFNLQPHFSGTTDGVATTSTTTHVATDGALGTTGSAQMLIPFDAATSPGGGGWAWQVRFLPNSGGSTNAQNPLFASDGYVGYFLKVDPAVAADMQTAPALESGSTTTGTTGDLKTVIKDGQWHLYQWNMDDPTQFDNTWDDVFGGGLGDTTLEASVSFDAIAVVSTSRVDATVLIDQIGYDNAGPLVPEPTTLAIGMLGSLGSLALVRRRAVLTMIR